jgi:GNAT superfamily N-acetyltransferase
LAVSEPLAIILQCPESDAIIGELWGESYYDWLFVNFLIAPDEFRNCGVGSALMKKAEEIAMSRGCAGIRLDTFSFQALGFYEKPWVSDIRKAREPSERARTDLLF